MERNHYFDLYNRAPVAYCTLSDSGLILEANLTSANMLGIPSLVLLKRSFSDFIHPAYQETYRHHCHQLACSGETQSCQLQLIKANGDAFWGNLITTIQQKTDGTLQQRLVIGDISQHQQANHAARKAELARSLLQSQEQSRQRFSSELHDRTSANLAALRLNLELILATASPSRDTQAFTNCVADTWALLEDTNAGIRDICQDLHPPAFDLGGLAAAVQSYAHAIHKRTGLKVQVECRYPVIDLPNDLELALFRIIQEALTNCIKHACASLVMINLQLDTQPLKIRMTDNGIGFDPDAATRAKASHDGQRPGQGLRHMRQAAEFFNASFQFESAPGRGTRISLEIPHPVEELRA